jgi:hypothetical protein
MRARVCMRVARVCPCLHAQGRVRPYGHLRMSAWESHIRMARIHAHAGCACLHVGLRMHARVGVVTGANRVPKHCDRA